MNDKIASRADCPMNLTEAESHLITNYRLLSPAIKALIYGYLDHLALHEACTGPEPCVMRGQHLAFIVPASEMRFGLGSQPTKPDSHLLVIISVFFDKAAVYEIAQNGAVKILEESDMLRILEIKEATLAAANTITPVEVEILVDKYRDVINGIAPNSIIQP